MFGINIMLGFLYYGKINNHFISTELCILIYGLQVKNALNVNSSLVTLTRARRSPADPAISPGTTGSWSESESKYCSTVTVVSICFILGLWFTPFINYWGKLPILMFGSLFPLFLHTFKIPDRIPNSIPTSHRISGKISDLNVC